MAKLKYDRPIYMRLINTAKATIPEGEVWKVTTNTASNATLTDASTPITNLYGGGYTFKESSKAPYLFITGIAFKHIDE